MSLTRGSAPFSRRRTGAFNFHVEAPQHVLYLEPSPRWVRVEFGGEIVADSCEVRLLHETGLLPVYYFPIGDLRDDLLEPTSHRTHCPFKGDASYWSVRVGEHVATNAVWSYPAPLEGAPPLAGLAAFYWDRMDAWYEEDERVLVHPRDPYTRVDAVASSRRVVLTVDGTVVADSSRPVAVFETSLPARWYLPREDVRTDLLVPSASTTRCPYKGLATYHHLRLPDGTTYEDLVWCYEEPDPAVGAIAGMLCFYDERIRLSLDGRARED
jgi:uncharacterized protein (DUF427 family)